MTLADKIVVLRGGRIEQVGTPAALYDDPDNLFVACFIGSPKMNVLPARTVAGGVEIAGTSLALPGLSEAAGQEVQLGIRPEHLRLAAGDERSLPFRVDFAEFLGGTTYVYGEVAPGMPLVIEGTRGLAPAPGTVLRLVFDPADARLFDGQGRRIRPAA